MNDEEKWEAQIGFRAKASLKSELEGLGGSQKLGQLSRGRARVARRSQA